MNVRPILISSALLAALGVAAPALAQTAPAQPTAAPAAPAAPRPHHRHHRHSPMHYALRAANLSADQRSQLRALHQRFKAAEAAGTPIAPKDRLAQTEAILTPQQRATFETNLKAARAKMRTER
ncbi:MAG: hypothetical protein ACREM2_07875 [Vulcanimicrobiaceae bacterium]